MGKGTFFTHSRTVNRVAISCYFGKKGILFSSSKSAFRVRIYVQVMYKNDE